MQQRHDDVWIRLGRAERRMDVKGVSYLGSLAFFMAGSPSIQLLLQLLYGAEFLPETVLCLWNVPGVRGD